MSDYFIFGDIDTRDYEGIYVYFDDIDATPSRVGEFIEIPGRNGSFYLDKGRYEDVTHTYNIVALTMEAGRDLINAISSQVGYHRLEDSFNPDEFYSAIFASEVEPNVPTDREQMTFKLMFTRKPQRWLTSGEVKHHIGVSGYMMDNPTLFDSSPLLEVEGGGTISFNGYNIELENAVYGDVELFGSGSGNLFDKDINFNRSIANAGDKITIASIRYRLDCEAGAPATFYSETASGSGYNHNYHVSADGMTVYIEVTDVEFEVGTASTIEYRVRFTQAGKTGTAPLTIRLFYDGSGDIFANTTTGLYATSSRSSWSAFVLHSTRYFINDTIYVDCDLGEAYKYEGGEIVSLNQYIDLGSELPVFGASNEITFDDTITSLDIYPRWWKV